MKCLKFARFALLALISLCSFHATQAATWLTLTPENFFQQDVVYEAGDSSSVNATFGSRYFYEDSRRGVSQYPGLQSSGLYTVTLNGNSIPFQLQPYNANNLRKLSPTSTATLPITAGHYSNLALAIAAGNVGSVFPTLGYTLNYSDSSTSTGSLLVPDWGQSAAGTDAVEIFNVGRASAASTFENVSNFSFFGISLAVDPSKTLSSVVFAPVGMSTGEIGILAISALAVPEPSVMACSCLALGLVLIRRRRI